MNDDNLKAMRSFTCSSTCCFIAFVTFRAQTLNICNLNDLCVQWMGFFFFLMDQWMDI